MPKTLIVVPSVTAAVDGDGFFLDRKMVEGLSLYAKLWPGPVRCLIRAGDRSGIAFGDRFRMEDLPFDLRIIPVDLSQAVAEFDDAAVVLAAGDSHHDLPLSGLIEAPVVFIIEYTLATRLKINRLHHGLSLQALKSAIWTIKTERRRRPAFRRAAGLQCNGTPAFDAYKALTPASLLYFDTRTTDSRQISAQQLEAKQDAMEGGEPLRIAFSGRLEGMKGADHLVPVAVELNRAGVPFTLDIYGDGALRASIAQQARDAGLDDQVTLHGPVPFEEELIPAMIARTDLFLCCHRQADPSCTYLETLSCGVPIVGYDNAAFLGVRALGDIGTAVPMDDVSAASKAIAALAADRRRLATMASNAARIGREHSFENVFVQRIGHLRQVAGSA